MNTLSVYVMTFACRMTVVIPTNCQYQHIEQRQKRFDYHQNWIIYHTVCYHTLAGVSPRSVAPPANTQSKQAITNMLRQRLPFTQMSQMQVHSRI